MKARKRGTNDPFEEIDYIQFKDRYDVYPVCMIEFENESEGNKPDVEYWEQLRHQAATAAMQAILSNPNSIITRDSLEIIPHNVILVADSLIEQLKKK